MSLSCDFSNALLPQTYSDEKDTIQEDSENRYSLISPSRIMKNLSLAAVPIICMLSSQIIPSASAGPFSYLTCMGICSAAVVPVTAGTGFLICLAECSPYAAPVLP